MGHTNNFNPLKRTTWATTNINLQSRWGELCVWLLSDHDGRLWCFVTSNWPATLWTCSDIRFEILRSAYLPPQLQVNWYTECEAESDIRLDSRWSRLFLRVVGRMWMPVAANVRFKSKLDSFCFEYQSDVYGSLRLFIDMESVFGFCRLWLSMNSAGWPFRMSVARIKHYYSRSELGTYPWFGDECTLLSHDCVELMKTLRKLNIHYCVRLYYG